METYALVAKLTTLRIILVVGNKYDFDFNQLGVKTAFLNGVIKEYVYIEQAEGVQQIKDMVCKLSRSLYGLKQSPKTME